MAQFVTTEERLKSSYRAIEALYRKNVEWKDIARELDLPYFMVLGTIQRIYGRDMMKKEREAQG